MPCKNVPICSEQYSYLFNYCQICRPEIDIEDAAIRSALNMGVPDWFQCGECGERYDTTALFLEHPCVKNANT